MSAHAPLENFRAWFVDVLERLYPIQTAGFAITMITLPLLERYLRQKANLSAEDDRLNAAFYAELLALFPELKSESKAKEFWQVYRNGILHQVAFSQKTSALPAGVLSRHEAGISFAPGGELVLNPVDFAKRITAQILAHFPTFEGVGSNAPTLAVEMIEAIDQATGELGKTTRTHPRFGMVVLKTSTRAPPKP